MNFSLLFGFFSEFSNGFFFHFKSRRGILLETVFCLPEQNHYPGSKVRALEMTNQTTMQTCIAFAQVLIWKGWDEEAFRGHLLHCFCQDDHWERQKGLADYYNKNCWHLHLKNQKFQVCKDPGKRKCRFNKHWKPFISRSHPPSAIHHVIWLLFKQVCLLYHEV